MKEIRWLVGFLIIMSGIVLDSCSRDPEFVFVQYDWDISSAEAQNMNFHLLDSAFIEAHATNFIDGLLVIRNGNIVGEAYYNGYTVATSHNIQSVSKSFLSAITGIAYQDGYIKSLDEKVLDYFPEYIYPDIDPRKYEITIEHLLSMRMGIQGEDEENYGVYQRLYNSENWIKETIEFPLIYDPGEKMRYNTFQTHLLSAILTKTTEQSTLDFARDELFNPLGIVIGAWEQDPQGNYFGGNTMHFTPRDMAVLGYLYMHKGYIRDTQIIPGSWIDLTLSPSTNLTHPNEWGAWKNYNYAYLWWLGEFNDMDMFMAFGYGGQFVMVFPELDLIVVTTAKFEVDSDTSILQEFAIFDILSKYILPSINI